MRKNFIAQDFQDIFNLILHEYNQGNHDIKKDAQFYVNKNIVSQQTYDEICRLTNESTKIKRVKTLLNQKNYAQLNALRRSDPDYDTIFSLIA